VDSPRVVEPDAVRVSGVAPHEHDVVHKGAAVVGCRRHVDRAHAPAVDLDPAQWTNPRLRIPRRSIDELRIGREWPRRGCDDEVLGPDIARADYPSSPRLGAATDTAGADDVQAAGPPRGADRQASGDASWTRDRIANCSRSRATLREQRAWGSDETEAGLLRGRGGCRGMGIGTAAESDQDHQDKNDWGDALLGHSAERTTMRGLRVRAH
jgi:hypothetical protein